MLAGGMGGGVGREGKPQRNTRQRNEVVQRRHLVQARTAGPGPLSLCTSKRHSHHKAVGAWPQRRALDVVRPPGAFPILHLPVVPPSQFLLREGSELLTLGEEKTDGHLR